jgi:hypothetical protein
VVPRSLHLAVELLDVFHRPGAIVGRDGAGLSYRVDVAHVIDRKRRIAEFALRDRVDVLDAETKLGTGRDVTWEAPREEASACS